MDDLLKKIKNNKTDFMVFTALIMFQIILPVYQKLHRNQSIYIFNELFFQISYILIAVLIFRNLNKLLQFNIGLMELLLFIVFPTIIPLTCYIISPHTYNLINKYALSASHNTKFSSIIIISSIILFITLILRRKEVNMRKSTRISNVNLLLCIVLIIVVSSTYIFLHIYSDNYTIRKEVFTFMYLSRIEGAVILTEFFYRGFLWGYLKLFNLKDKYIWILQGVLYCIV